MTRLRSLLLNVRLHVVALARPCNWVLVADAFLRIGRGPLHGLAFDQSRGNGLQGTVMCLTCPQSALQANGRLHVYWLTLAALVAELLV